MIIDSYRFCGGGGVPWTPQEIISDVEVWLKPFDTGTVTYSSGTSISVADQSGNSHDFEKTSGDIPTSGVDTVDGNNAIGFNGGSTEYLISSDNVPFRSAFFFGKADVSKNATWASQPANMCFLGGATLANAYIARGSLSYIPQGGSPSYSLHRTNGQTDIGNAGNINYPEYFTYIEYSANTANSKLHLGNLGSGTARLLEGFLGEMILFNTTLSSTDYEKVEGYASWRSAGDGSYLPAGHPYKSAAPTV